MFPSMLREPQYSALPIIILGAMLAFVSPQETPAAENGVRSAVVFAYQHVGEDSLPAGNLSLERFRAHVEELKNGGYHVLPLADVVAALKDEKTTLPPKSVAITFDGAYAATIEAVKPLLDEADLPYTVFFASAQADVGGEYMTWADLKSLRKDKRVTLAVLPSAYAHLTDETPENAAGMINTAVSKYRDAFGTAPAFFAWPYGEISTELKDKISGYGFEAAFGQQSGVAHPGADMLALPRFVMTVGFGDLDRFRLTATALPLPVHDVMPEDSLLGQDEPPLIGFTVGPEITDLSRLSCFVSDIGKVKLTQPGGNRVEIRLDAPPQYRRTRVNCTMPDEKTWRWFGMILLRPDIPADAGDDSDIIEEPESSDER